ncbi:hypothetical protein K9K77_01745, partial [Candidatus Babeliales bacterium]|nr:hypothetical protein [Candidatus Babeliales bacterium]
VNLLIRPIQSNEPPGNPEKNKKTSLVRLSFLSLLYSFFYSISYFKRTFILNVCIIPAVFIWL